MSVIVKAARPNRTSIPLVDLRAQRAEIGTEVNVAVQRVLDACDFTLGSAVDELETAFARYSGVPYGVGVGSGTDALVLTLRALGVGPGDEVIVPALTFQATASAVALCGGRPVFVDVRPGDVQIDADAVERAIGPRTRGILPVHLYGMLADLDALDRIAREHGLWLVEDAAQAHGASRGDRRVGSAGVATCFSFYPSKNLGAAGDAGMILTPDAELAGLLRQLRDHGRTSKYEHGLLGYGARLDTLQAAVLGVKLKHLDDWTARRRAAAERYDNMLGDRLERVGRDAREGAVHHVYAVRVAGGRRDAVLGWMQERGIGAGVHYPIPLHRQPAFSTYGVDGLILPVAEQAAAEVLSLPLYPEITPDQQRRVVNTLVEALRTV